MSKVKVNRFTIQKTEILTKILLFIFDVKFYLNSYLICTCIRSLNNKMKAIN